MKNSTQELENISLGSKHKKNTSAISLEASSLVTPERSSYSKMFTSLPCSSKSILSRTDQKKFKVSQKTLDACCKCWAESLDKNRKNSKKHRGSCGPENSKKVELLTSSSRKRFKKYNPSVMIYRSTSSRYLKAQPQRNHKKRNVTAKKSEWSKKALLRSSMTRKIELKLDSESKSKNKHIRILN